MSMQDASREASLHSQLLAVAEHQAGLAAPALSYAVATGGGTVDEGAVGVSDLSRHQAASSADQYPWFSMTKIATATAVMLLHVRGQLDVDAPVGEYLPGYARQHGQPTVRQFLTHTAGLANPLPIQWVRPEGEPVNRELVASIVRKHGRPKRPPGTRAAYSNIGYLLAGQVIEATTGTCVEQAITDLVLRPLHMVRTGFAAETAHPRATGYVGVPRVVEPVLRAVLPSGIAGPRAGGYLSLRPFMVEGAAYGGLIGPASDAVKLAAAHLPTSLTGPASSGPLGDVSDMACIRHRGRPFDHGTGWFRRPEDAARSPRFVEHYGTGVGFWNAMRIYPSLGIAAVAMTNATSRWPFDDFFTHVVDTLISGGESRPRSAPVGRAEPMIPPP